MYADNLLSHSVRGFIPWEQVRQPNIKDWEQDINSFVLKFTLKDVVMK